MASAVRSRPKRRILMIVHEALVPPEGWEKLTWEESNEFRTEVDVLEGLQKLGHEVTVLGLSDELAPLSRALRHIKPHVVFNLLEEFRDQSVYDSHVVSYLELRRAAYTGCNPRGLIIARDKALSKKILHYHRISVPHFTTFRRGKKVRRPKRLAFPLIVKSQIEEASYGIAQASVVWDDEALVERVAFIHENLRTDAIVEQYIEGRELYSAVLGNERLQVFPTWELVLDGLPEDSVRIATRKAKWDLAYQKKYGIVDRPAELDDAIRRRIVRLTTRIVRALGLDGYARIDFRLTPEGHPYFLEANPNPDVAFDFEFANAAKAGGLDYEQMLQRIVNLGIRRGA